MPPKTYEEMLEAIEDLRSLLSNYDSGGVLYALGAIWSSSLGSQDKLASELGLLSPFRQTLFIIGLLYSTPCPTAPEEFSKKALQEVATRVADIYEYYVTIFDPRELHLVTDDDWLRHQVAFCTFATYYGTPRVLGSIEQLYTRLEELIQFDAELQHSCGISATEFILVSKAVGSVLQTKLDAFSKNSEEVTLAHKEFCRIYDNEGLEAAARYTEELRAKPQLGQEWYRSVGDLGSIRRSDLLEELPEELVNRFWEAFRLRRPYPYDILRPTDANAAEVQGIFETSEGHALCPIFNSIVLGGILRFTQTLWGSEHKTRYLVARDEWLERRCESSLGPMLGSHARVYRSAYETEDSRFEYDLIIECERFVFIIEAKASRVREPFRDIDKAFIRIRDDFRGDGGIQKAYEQTSRLRRLLISEDVPIYDKRGERLAVIGKREPDEVFGICVTSENYGILATDLSLLLELIDDDPFPFAISINDLELLTDAFMYRGWACGQFADFLTQRSTSQGKAFADDELDIGGVFVRTGSLESIIKESAPRVIVPPTESRIFDEIWFERKTGRKADLGAGADYTSYLKTMSNTALRLGLLEPAMSKIRAPEVRKQGRNEACQCGSGKPFKQCCLEKWRKRQLEG